MADHENKRIWFPAKRYGWGWGPPVVWQGWAVVLVWVAIVLAGSALLIPLGLGVHVGFAVVMIGLLTAICYAKGERPRWRWGGDLGPRGGGPAQR